MRYAPAARKSRRSIHPGEAEATDAQEDARHSPFPHTAIPTATPYRLLDGYGLAGTEPECPPSPSRASDGTQTVLPSASPSTRTSTP